MSSFIIYMNRGRDIKMEVARAKTLEEALKIRAEREAEFKEKNPDFRDQWYSIKHPY